MYVKNLLRISEWAPALRDSILSTIVQVCRSAPCRAAAREPSWSCSNWCTLTWT
jgi:hypothetical protein